MVVLERYGGGRVKGLRGVPWLVPEKVQTLENLPEDCTLCQDSNSWKCNSDAWRRYFLGRCPRNRRAWVRSWPGRTGPGSWSPVQCPRWPSPRPGCGCWSGSAGWSGCWLWSRTDPHQTQLGCCSGCWRHWRRTLSHCKWCLRSGQ